MKKRKNKKRKPAAKKRTKQRKTVPGGPNLGPKPNQGGPLELSTERASATPLAKDASASKEEGHRLADRATSGSDLEGGVSGPLDTLQRWFSTVITDPRSAQDGIKAAGDIQSSLGANAVEDIVMPSDRLTVAERMHLYHYAYHARLIECLIDDYPTIQYALGEATFEVLAKKYIVAHPSNHPNLNHFGHRFADFCKTQSAWLDHANFVADLARLEWGMVEVIHAPPSPTLSMLALQEAGPERWPGARLSASSTLRFLQFDYPVNRFLQAMREGQSPAIPEPDWSAVAIYRPKFKVWRMTHTQPMAAVLQALLEGAPLGEALDRLSNFASTEGDVMIWFKEWVMGGFFAQVELEAATN